MLECTYPSFVAIREEAMREQTIEITERLAATDSSNRKHFIHQFSKASWTPSPNIGRIWLGLWNEYTLAQLMKPSIKAQMSRQNRQSYIHLTRKLTAPLLKAYYKMQDILTNTRCLQHTAHTHTLHTSTTTTQHSINIHPILREIIANTHIQYPPQQASSVLNHIDDLNTISSYTLSDAAFGAPNADGTV